MVVLNLTASEVDYLVSLLYAPATVRDAPDEALDILRRLSGDERHATWEALNAKVRNAGT